MTLFYMDPNKPSATPPLTLSKEDMEHKRLLDNWFAFTETLEPEISKVTFFPEEILPYEKKLYLDAFAREYKTHKSHGSLNNEILDSIAINVCNVNRFSNLIKQGIHKIYIQNVMDHPEQIAMYEKESLLDIYLQQSLFEDLYKFCESENFPKDVMYNSNLLFLRSQIQRYDDFYKEKMLGQINKSTPKNTQKASYKQNDTDKNDSAKDSKLLQWLMFILFSIAWIAIPIYFAKPK